MEKQREEERQVREEEGRGASAVMVGVLGRREKKKRQINFQELEMGQDL